MQTPEPPLIPGRIHGIRSWLINERSQRLTGIARHARWPAGRAMVARCPRTRREEGHTAPGHDCTCGIYANHPTASHARRLPVAFGRRRSPERVRPVLGVIEAWGAVEIHATGFRAQFARPTALAAFEGLPADERRRVEAVAERYGIEAWSVPDVGAFWERCVETGVRGLDLDTREDLLAGAHEILLEPGVRCVQVGNTPMGGEGYQLLGIEQDFGPRRIGGSCGYPGSEVLRIVGSHVRPAALQDLATGPGSTLTLVPERNLHDAHAVAVWDEHLTTKLGYVPSSHARRIRELVQSNRIEDVRVIWQWRDLRSGQRTELWMLVARSPVRLATADEIEAEEHSRMGSIPF